MPYRPTTRAAVVVAIVSPLALVQPLAALAFIAVIAAVVALDGREARSRAPKVRRVLPPFVVRGVPAPLTIEVVEGTGEVVQPGTDAVEVTPSTLVAHRRGRHLLPPALARVTGRRGMATWTGPVAPPAELVAHPDVLAARRLARAAQRMSFDEEAGRARGPLGLGTSFESLRDYVPDDDVRLINWKATARTGRAVVNQFRLEQARDVMILLDTGRLMTAPHVFDAAIDAATALALTVDSVGDRCGLVAFADSLRAQRAPRSGGGKAVAAAIAGIEPLPVDSDYETAFRALPTKRAVAVVITDLVDDAAAAAMQSAVPVLGRRHQVLLVATEDPALPAMISAAAAPKATARDAYRATAAATLLEDRDRAAAGLRRAGAFVAIAPPERLATVAVSAYLDLKARARA